MNVEFQDSINSLNYVVLQQLHNLSKIIQVETICQKNRQRNNSNRTLNAWVFTDEKVGHEKQSRAFLEILRNKYQVNEEFFKITRRGWINAFMVFCGFRSEQANLSEKPDIIIGTGHRTHIHMLAARRRHKGKIVVILKPSLPLNWFDLCIIPMHDSPPLRNNVIITEGAVSIIKHSENKNKNLGLVMLGGPNKQYNWSNKKVLSQISEIIGDDSNRDMQWKITTSRRTPISILEEFKGAGLTKIDLFPFEQTPSGWVEETLLSHDQVWVTQDSFSMIQDAIQSGGKVGILELDRRKKFSCLRKRKLKTQNLDHVTLFTKWRKTKSLKSSKQNGERLKILCSQSVLILDI